MRYARVAVLVILGVCAAADVQHLAAQTVTLQIRPRLGDTLRMRLDQQTEMTGVRRTSNGDANATAVATVVMFSRAIVEGESANGTNVLAVTDSVQMSSSDGRARAAIEQAKAQMRGQRVHFRVSPDGTVGLPGSDDPATRDVAQVVSLMPAAFPRGPIQVGDGWSREMPLPIDTQFGADLSGRLRVSFRFDSLGHGREWAYVSMRGEAEPATGPGSVSGTVLEKGFVTGTMVIDQRRRWLTESWFDIVVNSTVTPASSVGGVGETHVQMHITQHMHTIERR
ncbi:MAG TPA: hypothetical protein VHV78_10770 [Gemmatimonadaceae bacterium]|jgi:hypothetical protein|nr:hypothetical protein [Gemmatimonadaceae bacterium]